MGGCGRPPKPTALKVLQGTFRKDRARREPMPMIAARVPQPPACLKGKAREAWRTIAPRLHKVGLLTVLDYDLLATYCDLIAREQEAKEHLRNEGAVIETPKGPLRSPWLVTLEHARAELRAIGSLFGLNPSSRGRLDVDLGVLRGPEKDSYGEFRERSRRLAEERMRRGQEHMRQAQKREPPAGA